MRAEVLGEREIVELISTWKPSAYELARLNAGGVIEIGICATTQPPMRAYVVEPVEKELLPYVAPQKGVTINEDGHGF